MSGLMRLLVTAHRLWRKGRLSWTSYIRLMHGVVGLVAKE